MYSKITHTIVEEHFEHPMAVELAEDVKKKLKSPLRHYPGGQVIPMGLPMSYRLGTKEKHCGNCKAFDVANSTCSHWKEPVKANYVCDAWTAI